MVEVSNSINEFTEIVEKEIHHNKELLNLLVEEQRVITSGNIQAIEMNIRDQDHVIGLIRKLEESRMNAVKDIVNEYDIREDEITFKKIIDVVGVENSGKLHLLMDELKSVVKDIVKVNQNNSFLIGNGLAFIEENVKVFFGVNEKELLYGKEGNKQKEKKNMYRLVDKRI